LPAAQIRFFGTLTETLSTKTRSTSTTARAISASLAAGYDGFSSEQWRGIDWMRGRPR